MVVVEVNLLMTGVVRWVVLTGVDGEATPPRDGTELVVEATGKGFSVLVVEAAAVVVEGFTEAGVMSGRGVRGGT